jgi:hypothetical protein
MNTYKIDYDKLCVYLIYDGEDYAFNLTNGDIGDYWDSFFHNGQMYDINFYQEDSDSNPFLSVYKCKLSNDGAWEMDAFNYEKIPLYEITGDVHNFIN